MGNNQFKFYTRKDGDLGWKIIAPNNKKVGASSEGFSSKPALINNAKNNGYRGTGKRGWIKPKP